VRPARRIVAPHVIPVIHNRTLRDPWLQHDGVKNQPRSLRPQRHPCSSAKRRSPAMRRWPRR
jgi:hypothetical protein